MPARFTCKSGSSSLKVSSMPPKMREISVDRAAPAAPMLKTKIKMALPTTLIRFMTMDTLMGSLALPITLNSAEQVTNWAIKG